MMGGVGRSPHQPRRVSGANLNLAHPSGVRAQPPNFARENQAPSAQQSLHSELQDPDTGKRQETGGSPEAGLVGVGVGCEVGFQHLLSTCCVLHKYGLPGPLLKKRLFQRPRHRGVLQWGKRWGVQHSQEKGVYRCGQRVAMTKRKHQRAGFWPNQPPQSLAEGGVASGKEPVRHAGWGVPAAQTWQDS